VDHEHRLTIHIGLTSETITLVREVLAVMGGLSQDDISVLNASLASGAALKAKADAANGKVVS